MRCDAVIFGGGVAGLWLLDRLQRKGCSAVLFEATQLGSGQTVASQGIIHGGLKYTLQGLLTRSAANISEMPLLWRDCLAGRSTPDLSDTRVRAPFCYLWRTESLMSRLGMIGAKVGLRVAPQNLRPEERPDVLAACPGTVARLDEQVISPASLIANLQDLHSDSIFHYDSENGIEFSEGANGNVTRISLRDDSHPEVELVLEPSMVIFTAGAGNARLRALCGLPTGAMQRRPLHMLMVRGAALPQLNGHCVDGSRTRVTITSDITYGGETVWQVGGQLAEEGVTLSRPALVVRGRAELQAVLPGVDFSGVQWGTYRVDRAERAMPGGGRPDAQQILRDGNIITAWPTKLVLAPVMAEEIAEMVEPSVSSDEIRSIEWPRPKVALPPWEIAAHWADQESCDTLRESA